jgi:2-keto-4-pentenoate hydratase/2-oxohepta-3-ene-1,7-dioic acid hydratase in catechol pathway
MAKFLRVGAVGRETPAILGGDGSLRDLSAFIPDLAGEHLAPASLAALAAIDPLSLPPIDSSARVGPCVAGTSNFIAVGLNYFDHAREVGAEPPPEPIIFNKAPSCIVGACDPIVIPAGSRTTDWEVELAVVINRDCSEVPRDRAREFVAGYCICHDVSERHSQIDRGGQWVKGKSFPGFGPLGPWLVTPDEVPQISQARLWLQVNERIMQDGNTAQMIFKVDEIIAYVSQFMLLRAGDVITTGTPKGVGLGRKPEQYLKAGDVVRLGVDGLGIQQQRLEPHARDARPS